MDTEALLKLKELLDCGAISEEEFEQQKNSILKSGESRPKKKNIGLIIAVTVVCIICIFIIRGNFSQSEDMVVSEVSENSVQGAEVSDNSVMANGVTNENIVPTEFAEQCPIGVTASMYDNVIGVPELECSFMNYTNKEIVAIKLYFDPRNVYGESVSSMLITNQLYTDETIAANGSARRAWQLIDDEIKSGDVYVYSVYFSDGSEWGDKEATVSQLKKYGYKITAKY